MKAPVHRDHLLAGLGNMDLAFSCWPCLPLQRATPIRHRPFPLLVSQNRLHPLPCGRLATSICPKPRRSSTVHMIRLDHLLSKHSYCSDIGSSASVQWPKHGCTREWQSAWLRTLECTARQTAGPARVSESCSAIMNCKNASGYGGAALCWMCTLARTSGDRWP